MGQTPVEQGEIDLRMWALVLVALVIIVIIFALLAWFTAGPVLEDHLLRVPGKG